jgi:hypothetical protein
VELKTGNLKPPRFGAVKPPVSGSCAKRHSPPVHLTGRGREDMTGEANRG